MDKAHFLNVRRNRRHLTGGGQRKKNKSLSTTIFCGKMSWRVPYLVCPRPRWWSRWYGMSSWQRRLNGKARVASKVIIHKSRGDQFLWNRNWDLGWFWAGWQYWKKIGPIMSNFWERFFHVFMSKIFFFKYCSVRTKRLHKIEVKKQFLKNYIWI